MDITGANFVEVHDPKWHTNPGGETCRSSDADGSQPASAIEVDINLLEQLRISSGREPVSEFDSECARASLGNP